MQHPLAYIIMCLSALLGGFGYLAGIDILVVSGFIGFFIGLLVHQFGCRAALSHHKDRPVVDTIVDSVVHFFDDIF